ncbi:MAG: branched-chain amino acid aminotransferase [Firmicutes bacterium]|nr:branched-chain amino acid aminotransferase [Bacillota bacterium]MBR3260366.1 branched-chain amino acid aminotransferase [Bacillota bacterium]MBR4024025.1 branched-chain amino acid aminotransferase [Bacillota bacterium]MBR6955809.1 branched-chain amino acid aminotransferase [Bacillota bacterium]
MMEIKVTKTTNPKPIPQDESTLGFGLKFTDHMFLMDWDEGQGWHDARIVPYGPLEIDPASTVLHYALEIFEGLKAYRTAEGKIQLFRPIENAKRMNRSAARFSMPDIPEEDFVEAVKALVDVDSAWVPYGFGTSLYIRPFYFADQIDLALHKITHYRFVIIVSPSGSYYAEGLNPVKIMIEDEDVRAVRGGTGFTKCGGNYAASQRAGDRAMAKGYSQVLWLDGVERKYVEEVGAMNIMFKIDGVVVTPSIAEGSILPGITRKSILEYLRAKGIPCEERKISAEELMEAARTGRLEEAFGCGTAAVISPVGTLAFKDEVYEINGGKIGETSQWLYDTLTGIQWGKIEDEMGWVVPVK